MPTCLCSRLRGRKKWDTSTDPDAVARETNGALVVRSGATRHPPHCFCACQVCGSRWTVSVDVDVKELETLYVWKEEDWSEDDIALEREQEEASARGVIERQARRSVEQVARAEEARASAQAKEEARLRRLENGENGSYWWKWDKTSNCRIDASGVSVWEDEPSGAGGCTLEQFLANSRRARRVHRLLPAELLPEALDAARRLHEEAVAPGTKPPRD